MITPIRTTMAAAAALICVVGLTACHGASTGGGGGGGTTSVSAPASGGSTAPSTKGSTATVTVKNFMFMPMTLNVDKGTTVTWKFEDSTAHNVDFSGKSSFKSPDLNDGKTYSHTFNSPGTYSYICGIHPFMTAKIVVK